MRLANGNESLYRYSYCHERGTTERDSRHWIETVNIEIGKDLRLFEEIVDVGENGSCMNRNIKNDVAKRKGIQHKNISKTPYRRSTPARTASSLLNVCFLRSLESNIAMEIEFEKKPKNPKEVKRIPSNQNSYLFQT